MFDILLVAQVSMTADWPCWMDMGNGPVDMSYLCDGAMGNEPPAALTTPGLLNAPSPNLGLSVTYRNYLPSIDACIDQQEAIYIADPDLVLDYNVIEPYCAGQVPVVATFTTPGGQLQIVEDRAVGDFWIRVPNELDGFGSFERRSEAQDWARLNFAEFF